MGVTAKIGPKYQGVIPLPIRRKVLIHPQNEVLVEEVNGAIIILPKPTSFTEFMLGLGKEAWKGVDPKAYVRKERTGWK
jgi:bifunctional DNA-binding transcriptional regulator/antitoxin component of YhaV-PrlF toxin-antitoxin module